MMREVIDRSEVIVLDAEEPVNLRFTQLYLHPIPSLKQDTLNEVVVATSSGHMHERLPLGVRLAYTRPIHCP